MRSSCQQLACVQAIGNYERLPCAVKLFTTHAEVTVPSRADWEKDWQDNSQRSMHPKMLPAALTPMFGTEPAKILGWQAFWLKWGPKAAAPALQAVIQLLVEFLEPPLDAAAKQKPLTATWKSNRRQK